MVRKISKAAVIGSGIMGGGIAALLAGAGVKVLLLDIVPFNLTDEEKKDLLFTYKSDAGKGYASEFAVSRAVGLWMWDSMFKNKDKSKIIS